jgi:hypothetical protein
VAQTMYTHVSKCKNDIKGEKKSNKLKMLTLNQYRIVYLKKISTKTPLQRSNHQQIWHRGSSSRVAA